MKRALALLLLLATGCPGEKTASVPATPPPVAARAPSRPVVPPRVGDTYVFKLLGGGERRDEVVSVSSTSVTISRLVNFGLKKSEPVTVEVPLDAQSVTRTASSVDGPKVKDETLTVSGRAFPCEVHEKTWTFEKPRKSTETARDWLSDQFPFVLRSKANGFLMLDLVEIAAPKAAEPPR